MQNLRAKGWKAPNYLQYILLPVKMSSLKYESFYIKLCPVMHFWLEGWENKDVKTISWKMFYICTLIPVLFWTEELRKIV